MDWNLPRCAAVDLERGLRCAQTPGHDNPHAAMWTRPRGPVLLRRWRDGEDPVNNGRDQFGDYVDVATMSWAIGCPAYEMVSRSIDGLARPKKSGTYLAHDLGEGHVTQ